MSNISPGAAYAPPQKIDPSGAMQSVKTGRANRPMPTGRGSRMRSLAMAMSSGLSAPRGAGAKPNGAVLNDAPPAKGSMRTGPGSSIKTC